MWKEVENRKIDEARMAEAGRKRRKREEKTNDRGGDNKKDQGGER